VVSKLRETAREQAERDREIALPAKTHSESRIFNFRVCAESQLTAKARASELPRQTARRWRRDGALSYILAAGAG